MSPLKNLVFEISFIDPMSTLAIFLLWLHYYMLFFICLVMLFVCIIMVKLISDYNWTVFERTPFYFDLFYKADFLLALNYLFYSYLYTCWLQFCNLFLIFFRWTYLKIRNQQNVYPFKMSFWFTTINSPTLLSTSLIKFTKTVNFNQRASKTSILMNSVSLWLNDLLNIFSKKEEIKDIYGYTLNDKKNLSKDIIYYNYMSTLLNGFSCRGYFNTKVRSHLRKYSDFFHVYFWRSNLFFELQLAFIPFIIAVLLIVPSVIVTSFITDPERTRDFDEDSPANWIESTVDVIGHQWYWQYRLLNVAGNPKKIIFEANHCPSKYRTHKYVDYETISALYEKVTNFIRYTLCYYPFPMSDFPPLLEPYKVTWVTLFDSKETNYLCEMDLWIPEFSQITDYSVKRFNIENSNLSVLVEDDFADNKKRLVDVDKKLFLKPGSRTKFLITSADVIHSFALPALGIKLDAVPYRLSYQVPRIRNYEAIIYGFCSELCGVQHAQMPIEAVVTDIIDDDELVE